MLARGGLVVYEKEKHIRSARYCFVVHGPAPVDRDGTSCTFVQMVSPAVLQWSVDGPRSVATADLTPIEEYGVRLRAVSHARGPREIWLERFGSSGSGRDYFGTNPMYAGTIWETDLWAMSYDDVFDIVRDRLCALERTRAAA